MSLALVYFVFAVLSFAISAVAVYGVRTLVRGAKKKRTFTEQDYMNLHAAVHGNPSKLELPKKKPNPVDKDGLPLFRCGTIWERGDENGWSSCQRTATRFWISKCNSPIIYCRCDRCDFGNVMNGQDGTKEEATNLVVVQQLMLEDEIE